MNNLPANVQDLDVNQLAALMAGPSQEQNKSEETTDLFPLLRINHQEEDDDGNELKKGVFFIQGEDIPVVYAKEVNFRALGDFMQYLHYDSDQQAVINRTVITMTGDYKAESIDETGSLRCGRPVGKEFHALPDAEKKKYTGITCFRYLYGVVSYTGTTATGEEMEIPPTPCLFRVKGASFLNFTKEVIDPSNSQGVPFTNVNSTLFTERKKNGGVTYFTSHFNPDFKETVELSLEDGEIIKHILTLVHGVNNEVRRKYDESIRGATKDSKEAELVDIVAEG